MSDSDILSIWTSHPDHSPTRSWVFSCAVAAIENNGQDFARKRVLAVLRLITAGKFTSQPVIYEIRGTSGDASRIKDRQDEFKKIMHTIRDESDRLSNFAASNADKKAMASKLSTADIREVDINIPSTIGNGTGFGNTEENKEVEHAAIALVKKRYEDSGWSVRNVEHERCGYDLECTRKDDAEHVEVKGIRGTEVAFIITVGEVKRAGSDNQFRLIAVSSALTDHPTVVEYEGSNLLQLFELSPLQFRATLKR